MSKKEEKELKKTTKKNLRTIRKTNAKHPIREEGRILKYGTKGFTRNIWLSVAATAVMTITLIILFATVVASVILTNTAEMMREKIDITIYFKPNTSEKDLNKLSDIISKDSNIKSVVLSTSEQEYEKLLEDYADKTSLLEVIDEDDFRAVSISMLQATMRIKVYDVDNLDSIREIVETDETFQAALDEKQPTYDVNQVEITTITSWARIARTAGLVLAGVFLAISILIIFSTIRMAIFSRREEIYMMRLVGADKRFVRGPFLVEAEICGVIAGALAATASYFGFEFLAPRLASYGIDVTLMADILESNKLIFIYLIFIGLGVFIGRAAAHLAVGKYLHKSS